MDHIRKRKAHSEETKAKISAGNKGKKRSEETKEKIRKANLGNKLSNETKEKIAQKLREYWATVIWATDYTEENNTEDNLKGE